MKPSLEKKLGKVTYNEQVIELSGGETEEWKPNPTWWDIEKILAEDTRDYEYKAIVLLYANREEDILSIGAQAYATSDGAFYTLDKPGEVTHSWDLTKDKPCIINGEEVYKTRYFIAYSNDVSLGTYMYFNNNNKTTNKNILYICTNKFIQNRSSYFNSNYMLEGVTVLDKNSEVFTNYMFQGCSSLKYISHVNIQNGASVTNMFAECCSIENLPELNSEEVTNFSSFCKNCKSLKEFLNINTEKGEDFSNMLSGCSALENLQILNTNNATTLYSTFDGCNSLKHIRLSDTSNVTNFQSTFSNCASLRNVYGLNTSKGTAFFGMFYACRSLQDFSNLDVSNGTNFGSMFYYCENLTLINELNTFNGTSFSSMFNGCLSLHTIKLVDLLNATSVSLMFNNCKSLKNLTLKNIKISLQIGSGTTYGHLLTLDSLTNTIKELWDNTSGSSTLTLTVGSANLEKLANVYVKLIDITDEMRAEDEYIDNKKPFEVCESTDEGAMLITEYVTSKGWQIA